MFSKTTSTSNSQGILLMITAMAGFTLEDLFIKKLASTNSTAQILLIFGICSAVFFFIIAKRKGHRAFSLKMWNQHTIIRAIAEAVAAVSFVIALSRVPLSTVAAILQASPLMITLAAALLLQESVGWRRWLAIFIGFFGVLLIIKPGIKGFDPNVIFAVITVISISIRDLATRKVPDSITSSVISFQAYFSIIVVAILLLIFSTDRLTPIDSLEAGYFLGGVIFGTAGYYGIVAAMRVGEVSVISPFRYTRLLFSLVVGVMVFHERPDSLTLLGAGIIICTGLYTFLRERHLKGASI